MLIWRGLYKLNTSGSANETITIESLKSTTDRKYMYAIVSVKGIGSGRGVYYRAIDGKEWKYMNGGHDVATCSSLKDEAIEFMKAYCKEVKTFVSCMDKDGKTINYGD